MSIIWSHGVTCKGRNPLGIVTIANVWIDKYRHIETDINTPLRLQVRASLV